MNIKGGDRVSLLRTFGDDLFSFSGTDELTPMVATLDDPMGFAQPRPI
jgi:hypothetical protein